MRSGTVVVVAGAAVVVTVAAVVAMRKSQAPAGPTANPNAGGFQVGGVNIPDPSTIVDDISKLANIFKGSPKPTTPSQASDPLASAYYGTIPVSGTGDGFGNGATQGILSVLGGGSS